MYIKFHQNLVSRSIKTVNTNVFSKCRKLHKFATTNVIISVNLQKIDYLRHASSYNVHVCQFSANKTHCEKFAT